MPNSSDDQQFQISMYKAVKERFFKLKFWKQLNQRTKILLQKTNIAVHHEVETVYSLWQAFLPTTDVTWHHGIDIKSPPMWQNWRMHLMI